MNNRNALQDVELDLLKKFMEVCAGEGLVWYAMLGTLLGASRHGGFIPWDDDVDVAMPRADYDRLRSRPDWFGEPYFLQTPQNDPGAAAHFMRLRRSDTALLKDFPDGMTLGGNMGVYIDIIPLDRVPGPRQAEQLHEAAMRMQRQMRACAALDAHPNGAPPWKALRCYGDGGVEGCYRRVAARYEQVCARYPKGPYYAMPVLSSDRGCRVYDRRWFSGRETMDFEDVKVFAPAGWREVLVASYPDGLLTPSESERGTKTEDTGVIVDTERSYTHYLSRYTDMLKGVGGKRVYLFGAGDSLRIWLERYGRDLEVACTFDNAKHKWGTSAYGVPVRPPAELPQLLDENARLIVASVWHKEIGRQLESMGVSDYYVFLDGWHYQDAAN